jgi:DNA-directed RNA polymerase specialized sigma24 family protein
VIVLARIENLGHREIAQRLGKSEGAVRTMLCRALAELAEYLH